MFFYGHYLFDHQHLINIFFPKVQLIRRAMERDIQQWMHVSVYEINVILKFKIFVNMLHFYMKQNISCTNVKGELAVVFT